MTQRPLNSRVLKITLNMAYPLLIKQLGGVPTQQLILKLLPLILRRYPARVSPISSNKK